MSVAVDLCFVSSSTTLVDHSVTPPPPGNGRSVESCTGASSDFFRSIRTCGALRCFTSWKRPLLDGAPVQTGFPFPYDGPTTSPQANEDGEVLVFFAGPHHSLNRSVEVVYTILEEEEQATLTFPICAFPVSAGHTNTSGLNANHNAIQAERQRPEQFPPDPHVCMLNAALQAWGEGDKEDRPPCLRWWSGGESDHSGQGGAVVPLSEKWRAREKVVRAEEKERRRARKRLRRAEKSAAHKDDVEECITNNNKDIHDAQVSEALEVTTPLGVPESGRRAHSAAEEDEEDEEDEEGMVLVLNLSRSDHEENSKRKVKPEGSVVEEDSDEHSAGGDTLATKEVQATASCRVDNTTSGGTAAGSSPSSPVSRRLSLQSLFASNPLPGDAKCDAPAPAPGKPSTNALDSEARASVEEEKKKQRPKISLDALRARLLSSPQGVNPAAKVNPSCSRLPLVEHEGVEEEVVAKLEHPKEEKRPLSSFSFSAPPQQEAAGGVETKHPVNDSITPDNENYSLEHDAQAEVTVNAADKHDDMHEKGGGKNNAGNEGDGAGGDGCGPHPLVPPPRGIAVFSLSLDNIWEGAKLHYESHSNNNNNNNSHHLNAKECKKEKKDEEEETTPQDTLPPSPQRTQHDEAEEGSAAGTTTTRIFLVIHEIRVFFDTSVSSPPPETHEENLHTTSSSTRSGDGRRGDGVDMAFMSSHTALCLSTSLDTCCAVNPHPSFTTTSNTSPTGSHDKNNIADDAVGAKNMQATTAKALFAQPSPLLFEASTHLAPMCTRGIRAAVPGEVPYVVHRERGNDKRVASTCKSEEEEDKETQKTPTGTLICDVRFLRRLVLSVGCRTASEEMVSLPHSRAQEITSQCSVASSNASAPLFSCACRELRVRCLSPLPHWLDHFGALLLRKDAQENVAPHAKGLPRKVAAGIATARTAAEAISGSNWMPGRDDDDDHMVYDEALVRVRVQALSLFGCLNTMSRATNCAVKSGGPDPTATCSDIWSAAFHRLLTRSGVTFDMYFADQDAGGLMPVLEPLLSQMWAITQNVLKRGRREGWNSTGDVFASVERDAAAGEGSSLKAVEEEEKEGPKRTIPIFILPSIPTWFSSSSSMSTSPTDKTPRADTVKGCNNSSSSSSSNRSKKTSSFPISSQTYGRRVECGYHVTPHLLTISSGLLMPLLRECAQQQRFDGHVFHGTEEECESPTTATATPQHPVVSRMPLSPDATRSAVRILSALFYFQLINDMPEHAEKTREERGGDGSNNNNNNNNDTMHKKEVTQDVDHHRDKNAFEIDVCARLLSDLLAITCLQCTPLVLGVSNASLLCVGADVHGFIEEERLLLHALQQRLLAPQERTDVGECTLNNNNNNNILQQYSLVERRRELQLYACCRRGVLYIAGEPLLQRILIQLACRAWDDDTTVAQIMRAWRAQCGSVDCINSNSNRDSAPSRRDDSDMLFRSLRRLVGPLLSADPRGGICDGCSSSLSLIETFQFFLASMAERVERVYHFPPAASLYMDCGRRCCEEQEEAAAVAWLLPHTFVTGKPPALPLPLLALWSRMRQQVRGAGARQSPNPLSHSSRSLTQQEFFSAHFSGHCGAEAFILPSLSQGREQACSAVSREEFVRKKRPREGDTPNPATTKHFVGGPSSPSAAAVLRAEVRPMYIDSHARPRNPSSTPTSACGGGGTTRSSLQAPIFEVKIFLEVSGGGVEERKEERKRVAPRGSSSVNSTHLGAPFHPSFLFLLLRLEVDYEASPQIVHVLRDYLELLRTRQGGGVCEEESSSDDDFSSASLLRLSHSLLRHIEVGVDQVSPVQGNAPFLLSSTAGDGSQTASCMVRNDAYMVLNDARKKEELSSLLSKEWSTPSNRPASKEANSVVKNISPPTGGATMGQFLADSEESNATNNTKNTVTDIDVPREGDEMVGRKRRRYAQRGTTKTQSRGDTRRGAGAPVSRRRREAIRRMVQQGLLQLAGEREWSFLARDIRSGRVRQDVMGSPSSLDKSRFSAVRGHPLREALTRIDKPIRSTGGAEDGDDEEEREQPLTPARRGRRGRGRAADSPTTGGRGRGRGRRIHDDIAAAFLAHEAAKRGRGRGGTASIIAMHRDTGSDDEGRRSGSDTTDGEGEVEEGEEVREVLQFPLVLPFSKNVPLQGCTTADEESSVACQWHPFFGAGVEAVTHGRPSSTDPLLKKREAAANTSEPSGDAWYGVYHSLICQDFLHTFFESVDSVTNTLANALVGMLESNNNNNNNSNKAKTGRDKNRVAEMGEGKEDTPETSRHAGRMPPPSLPCASALMRSLSALLKAALRRRIAFEVLQYITSHLLLHHLEASPSCVSSSLRSAVDGGIAVAAMPPSCNQMSEAAEKLRILDESLDLALQHHCAASTERMMPHDATGFATSKRTGVLSAVHDDSRNGGEEEEDRNWSLPESHAGFSALLDAVEEEVVGGSPTLMHGVRALLADVQRGVRKTRQSLHPALASAYRCWINAILAQLVNASGRPERREGEGAAGDASGAKKSTSGQYPSSNSSNHSKKTSGLLLEKLRLVNDNKNDNNTCAASSGIVSPSFSSSSSEDRKKVSEYLCKEFLSSSTLQRCGEDGVDRCESLSLFSDSLLQLLAPAGNERSWLCANRAAGMHGGRGGRRRAEVHGSRGVPEDRKAPYEDLDDPGTDGGTRSRRKDVKQDSTVCHDVAFSAAWWRRVLYPSTRLALRAFATPARTRGSRQQRKRCVRDAHATPLHLPPAVSRHVFWEWEKRWMRHSVQDWAELLALQPLYATLTNWRSRRTILEKRRSSAHEQRAHDEGGERRGVTMRSHSPSSTLLPSSAAAPPAVVMAPLKNKNASGEEAALSASSPSSPSSPSSRSISLRGLFSRVHDASLTHATSTSSTATTSTTTTTTNNNDDNNISEKYLFPMPNTMASPRYENERSDSRATLRYVEAACQDPATCLTAELFECVANPHYSHLPR